MSNALAIAHVTQALALLIESNLGPEFDEAVKVEPRKPPAEPPDQPTINVFLYQVTPNTSMRNSDLPTRASDGTLIKRPAAALDLHYLISAYGDETELVGQRLVGSVVRTLHEIPILPKDVIEQAGERPYLVGSDLAEAVQRVRFTPTVMDIDETSKLWGMLYQTPYSLSVVYQATLIFIDGRERPVPAKPVERPEVRVLPFGAPGAPEPAVVGDGASTNRSGGDVEVANGTEKAEKAETPEKPAARTAEKAPSKAPVKAPAKTAAKSPAKAPVKAPARGRKAAQASKPTGGTARGTQTDSAAEGTEN
ncbi:Pvc16 family protein [Streptomyces sp. R28]|uniref:Pvc16 family protein n=1 Tax=Streptomyces sp. R28 TaxID=3238628 RepID=A0AB39PRD8_9ACTN